MYSTINLKGFSLKEILNQFQTNSHLEEMLSLMLEDRKISEINITGQQLYKEQQLRFETVKHWSLTMEELDDFYTQFKQVVSSLSGENLDNASVLNIALKDSRISLGSPPIIPNYSIVINKSPELYSFDTQSISRSNQSTGESKEPIAF